VDILPVLTICSIEPDQCDTNQPLASQNSTLLADLTCIAHQQPASTSGTPCGLRLAEWMGLMDEFPRKDS
jgi:hypothetical protein